MMRGADVVVVGGGVIGASIAHALSARRAGDVLLVEQGTPGALGATARSGGLLRMHHTFEGDTRLAVRSHRTYVAWKEEVGGDCGFRRTGFAMVVGPGHADRLRANAAAVAACGYDTRVVGPEELAELQPSWSAEGVGAAAWEPESGYANPVRTTRALVERARERGLRVREGTKVHGLLRSNGRVGGVRTSRGDVSSDVVVLAGGAWSRPLLAELGLDVPVEAVHIGTCLIEGAPLGESAAFCTAIDDTTGTYFRPDGGDRVVAGVPTRRSRVVPDAEPPPLAPGELDESRSRLARRVPPLAGARVVATTSGFDAYTPDKHPLIGPVEGVEGAYLAVGFSGGGFKVAPAVGEAVAAEIAGGERRDELEPFRPDRFERGRPVEPRHPYAHM